jgi:hypothetical protein
MASRKRSTPSNMTRVSFCAEPELVRLTRYYLHGSGPDLEPAPDAGAGGLWGAV